jgi:hypothetical protein
MTKQIFIQASTFEAVHTECDSKTKTSRCLMMSPGFGAADFLTGNSTYTKTMRDVTKLQNIKHLTSFDRVKLHIRARSGLTGVFFTKILRAWDGGY